MTAVETVRDGGRLGRPAGLGRWLTGEERNQLDKPTAARVALERAIGDTKATPHVSAWLKTISSANTRRGYAIDCLAFVDWLRDRTKVYDEPLEFRNVTELMVADYVEHIREAPSHTGKPLSVASQARRLSSISVMFRYLKHRHLVTANPLVDVERPTVSREGMTPALHLADIDKLLAAARESRYDADRDLALVALLSVQAIRVSEALNADVTDMGTERGRRTLRVVLKRGKQKRITLDATVAHILDAYLGARTTGPLVLSNSGARMSPESASRILARLSRAAGVPTVKPHMLRTSAITHLLEKNLPQHQIQRMVGHESADTTGRYWRRLNGAEQDAMLTATLAAGLPSLVADSPALPLDDSPALHPDKTTPPPQV